MVQSDSPNHWYPPKHKHSRPTTPFSSKMTPWKRVLDCRTLSAVGGVSNITTPFSTKFVQIENLNPSLSVALILSSLRLKQSKAKK